MIILYMIFLLPLTIDAYHFAEYGQYCSDSRTRITTRAACKAAADALGLDWGNGWWGPGDFAGCLYTRDSRKKVYFNYSPHASNDPSIKPNYAEICTGAGVGGRTELICTPNPSCAITGCDEGCCLDGLCCNICPRIINPPKEEFCGECSDTLECPGNCPYCFVPHGSIFGRCYGDSGLRDQIHLDLDSEIANLTSSNLAEFQSSNSDCSWWRCAISVVKALYYCAKKCGGKGDCIVPCAKKVLNSIPACWPCIKKGCCKLRWPCCNIEKEAFIEAIDGSNDLIIIGGDNKKDGVLSSPQIITSSGVCNPSIPRTIPPLLQKTTGGGLAWMKSENTLVFCGGSQTFVPETGHILHYGATNLCYSLKAGSSLWSSVGLCPSNVCGTHHQNDMTSERSWFSLTTVKDSPGEIIAVGGIDNTGHIWNTIEKYSVAQHTWKPFQPSLANPRFGHCAVHYEKGDKSYLILIGGSKEVPSNSGWSPLITVEQIDLKTGTISTLNNLPKGLWSPACTISNGFIYVSGGSSGNPVTSESGVYRYSFSTNTWSPRPIGHLNYPRWGAVMGTTLDGPFGQLIVAGGYDYSTGTWLHSIESSNNGGFRWNMKQTGLNKGREYASMVPVKPGTFTC